MSEQKQALQSTSSRPGLTATFTVDDDGERATLHLDDKDDRSFSVQVRLRRCTSAYLFKHPLGYMTHANRTVWRYCTHEAHNIFASAKLYEGAIDRQLVNVFDLATGRGIALVEVPSPRADATEGVSVKAVAEQVASMDVGK